MTNILAEQRSCIVKEFDVEYYLQQAPFLRNGNIDPVMHYLLSGWQEGFDPCPSFSTNYYLMNNPDVRDSGQNPFYHYVAYGRAEGRYARKDDPAKVENDIEYEMKMIQTLFNSAYYVSQMPELQGESERAILRHFVTKGWRLGLDPSPDFSTSLYLENYPDVRKEAVNPLLHYAAFGLAEGRAIFPPVQKSAALLVKEMKEVAEQLEFLEPVSLTKEAVRGEGDPSDVRAIAFFYPYYYPTPENDVSWGKGLTAWSAVANAKPKFKDHYQPHLPFDFGFYDLRVDETRRDQIAAARLAGIHGFCFNYFRLDTQPSFTEPLQRFLADTSSDFPFCLCWSNGDWRGTEGREVALFKQKHNLETDIEFIREIMPFLTDLRYIRIFGKPLLIISRPDLFNDIRSTLDAWRREFRLAGGSDIYLCYIQASSELTPVFDGFDAVIEAPWRVTPALDPADDIEELAENFSGKIYDYAPFVRQSLNALSIHNKSIRSIFCGLDESAVKGDNALIFKGATSQLYEYWLRGALEHTRVHRSGDERIIFIHAWNNWGGGAHLEPDLKHRRSYIEATRRALTKRTDPEILLQLLYDKVAQAEDCGFRDELLSNIAAVSQEYRALSITERYFNMEKIVNDKLSVERSCATFQPIDINQLFGARVSSEIKFSLEDINSRRFKTGQMIDGTITNSVRGWIAADGIFPDSLTTSRYILIRRLSTDEIYGAKIPGIDERNDVAKYFSGIDKKYTQFSGFMNVFSFAEIPGGAYAVGFGLKSDNKAALGWGNFMLRVVN